MTLKEFWGMQSTEGQELLINLYYQLTPHLWMLISEIENMILAYHGGDFGDLFAQQDSKKNTGIMTQIMTQGCGFFVEPLSVVPLLQQVAIGGYDDLKKMLNSVVRENRDLLEQKGSISYKLSVLEDCNESFYYENLTVLQLAWKLGDKDIWVEIEGQPKKVADGIVQLIMTAIKECYGEEAGVEMIWQQLCEIDPTMPIIKKLNKQGGPEAAKAFCEAINAIREVDEEQDNATPIDQNCQKALATFQSKVKEAPNEAIEYLQDQIALRKALRAIRVANTAEEYSAAREAFREYFAKKSKQPSAPAEELLSDVIQVWEVTEAIRLSNTNTDCQEALDALRDHFNAKKGHVNAELVYETEKFYRRNYDNMGGFDSRQNKLFRIQVIGYQQRRYSTFTLLGHAFGLYNMLVAGKKLVRSFEFRYDKDVLILPLDSKLDFRLGFEYYGVRVAGYDWGGAPALLAPRAAGPTLRNLCRAQTSALPVLCNVQTNSQKLNPHA